MYRIFTALLLLSAFTIPMSAHGNEQHVIGFVTRISGNDITVNTVDKKEVTVTATAKTEFYEGKTRASLGQLKVGDRVVIHAIKKESKLEAHTVKFAPPSGSAS